MAPKSEAEKLVDAKVAKETMRLQLKQVEAERNNLKTQLGEATTQLEEVKRALEIQVSTLQENVRQANETIRDLHGNLQTARNRISEFEATTPAATTPATTQTQATTTTQAVPATWTCPNGHVNDVSSAYCPRCGVPQTPTQTTTVERKSKTLEWLKTH